jgi:hypothetical protein
MNSSQQRLVFGTAENSSGHEAFAKTEEHMLTTSMQRKCSTPVVHDTIYKDLPSAILGHLALFLQHSIIAIWQIRSEEQNQNARDEVQPTRHKH